MITIFRGGLVFDGVTSAMRELEVAVEGQRIKEVSDRPITINGARYIELRGRSLMPGLIDAHLHVYSIHTARAKEQGMAVTYMAQKAAHRVREILDRGFTAARDAAGADFGIKDAIADGLIPGPRLFISGNALSQTGGHGDQRLRTESATPVCSCQSALSYGTHVVDGPVDVRRAAREELRKGADQIKVMASGGVGSPFDRIDNIQYSLEELQAAVEEAESWNTYVAAHSYTSRSTQRAVKAGVRTIEHGNLIDDETARIMAEHGAFMVPTLVAYSETMERGRELGLSDTVMGKLKIVHEGGIALLEKCKRAGVEMGFGTDLMGELNDAQSKEFLIREQVLDRFDILKSATSVNARILNREGELGEIKAGAYADLLVVDGDPSRDFGLLQDQGAHLSVIMQGGRFHKNRLG